MAKLRLELVSRVDFEALEEKVKELQSGGFAIPQSSFLRDQTNRLDPANKSLCFSGFKSTSTEARTTVIRAFLDSQGVNGSNHQIQHVYQGPPGARKLSSIAIVELFSRDVREEVLKKVLQNKTTIAEADKNTVSLNRAKTAWQLKRNANLKKALEVLKKKKS